MALFAVLLPLTPSQSSLLRKVEDMKDDGKDEKKKSSSSPSYHFPHLFIFLIRDHWGQVSHCPKCQSATSQAMILPIMLEHIMKNLVCLLANHSTSYILTTFTA